MATNGPQCSLLALLAFLPIGGLALLSPEQVEAEGSTEFGLAAVVLSRFLTPPVAALIVAYLARKDGHLSPDCSLWRAFKRNALPSIGLVLAVAVFGALASVFLVIPGVAFFLATCVVLPVLVIEGVSSPVAVKRSWELTRDHRWGLLAVWACYYLLSFLILSGIVVATTTGAPDMTEPLPLVQTDAFLPLVLVGSVLYAAQVIASYEIYTQLASESPVE